MSIVEEDIQIADFREQVSPFAEIGEYLKESESVPNENSMKFFAGGSLEHILRRQTVTAKYSKIRMRVAARYCKHPLMDSDVKSQRGGSVDIHETRSSRVPAKTVFTYEACRGIVRLLVRFPGAIEAMLFVADEGPIEANRLVDEALLSPQDLLEVIAELRRYELITVSNGAVSLTDIGNSVVRRLRQSITS